MVGILTALNALNIAEWAGIIAAFILAFDRLSKITPTQTDDKAVAAARKVFSVLGVRVPDVQKSIQRGGGE